MITIVNSERLLSSTAHSVVQSDIELAIDRGIKIETLVIDDLRSGWSSPLAKGHFRSGCAPIEALSQAENSISQDPDRMILVEGRDLLKSKYSTAERQDLMRIYGASTIPEAYTELTYEYLSRRGFSEFEFRIFCEALFKNYCRTMSVDLSEEYSNDYFVTKLFKRFDCANPNVDFIGRVLLASSDLSRELYHSRKFVEVKYCHFESCEGDGPDHAGVIASFRHLHKLFDHFAINNSLSISELFKNPALSSELYTCFPIVPLAFIIESGIATDLPGAIRFVDSQPVTITGGMNLARAPWNNPTLSAIIQMNLSLVAKGSGIGLIHGNGGLGFKQGLALLSLSAT